MQNILFSFDEMQPSLPITNVQVGIGGSATATSTWIFPGYQFTPGIVKFSPSFINDIFNG